MKRRTNRPILVLLAGIAILFAANLGIIFGWVLPAIQAPIPTAPQEEIAATSPAAPSPPPTETVLPSPSPTNPTATLPPKDALEGLRQQGVIVMSMADGAYYHLFAYHPQFLPLTRLTNTPWDDIDPAISPDGSQIAYASHQNGYWDIYVLDLKTGNQSRVTDTPAFDGSPTWSPDGQLLAIETYTSDGMQIFIHNLVDKTQAPVQLTFAPGQNFSPAWSPKGREIAFVSTRSDQEDIWLARFDRIDDRFIDISQNGTGRDRSPRWSPTGDSLAWTTDTPGTSVLMIWDPQDPLRPARQVAIGSTPVWGADGGMLLSENLESDQTSLAVYQASDGSVVYPPARLPGHLQGLDWRTGAAPDLIASYPVPVSSRAPAAPLYQPVLTVQSGLQKNRMALVTLKDIAAPYPYLSDGVDESFQALRQQIARETGWDFLASLENAYLPVTTPSLPELNENWLYTGRAVAINPTPLSAGWVTLTREDINGQTFWRMYVRCLYQDASCGQPLDQRPWDLDARYRGDPRIYDQGGEYAPIPDGYWVDFTDLAERYGWERLPALINWRTYYPATQFGIFVLRDGLNWQNAMDQLYPVEAVATPTLWVTLTPSITPTPTLWYQHLITPSVTPTPTLTATLHPTTTPLGSKAP
jgi:TolB protein